MTAVASPSSRGSTPRNSPAVECSVKTRRAVSAPKISVLSLWNCSTPTSVPATPEASRKSSDVPTNSLPIVRGSPEPTTAASPVGGTDGAGAAAASTAAARGASVTVMDAPWSGELLCSGI
jgi:hypothetical protein